MGDMSLIFSNSFSQFSVYFPTNRSGGSTIADIIGYLTQTPPDDSHPRTVLGFSTNRLFYFL